MGEGVDLVLRESVPLHDIELFHHLPISTRKLGLFFFFDLRVYFVLPEYNLIKRILLDNNETGVVAKENKHSLSVDSRHKKWMEQVQQFS